MAAHIFCLLSDGCTHLLPFVWGLHASVAVCLTALCKCSCARFAAAWVLFIPRKSVAPQIRLAAEFYSQMYTGAGPCIWTCLGELSCKMHVNFKLLEKIIFSRPSKSIVCATYYWILNSIEYMHSVEHENILFRQYAMNYCMCTL